MSKVKDLTFGERMSVVFNVWGMLLGMLHVRRRRGLDRLEHSHTLLVFCSAAPVAEAVLTTPKPIC